MSRRRSHIPVTLIALMSIWLPTERAHGAPPAAPAPGHDTVEYDRVNARVPRDGNRIAPAALAAVKIALHRAKKQAAEALCQGNWLPAGELVEQLGPTALKPGSGEDIWAYQSLRRAQPLVCERVSRREFLQEMNRNLPAWIAITPAGTASAPIDTASTTPAPHRLAKR